MIINFARLVAFGDSITSGEGIPRGYKNWTHIIEERFNLQLINSGIGGNTSSQGLERIEKDVLVHRPDFVLINFCMNDHVMEEKNKPKVDIKLFKENITIMIDKIRESGAIPIFVTTNYIIEGDENQYYYSRHKQSDYDGVKGAQAFLDTYIDAVRELGKLKNIDIIDVRKACEKYDRYEFLRTLRNDIIADGVHPHLLGASVYAEIIGDYLEDNYGQK